MVERQLAPFQAEHINLSKPALILDTVSQRLFFNGSCENYFFESYAIFETRALDLIREKFPSLVVLWETRIDVGDIREQSDVPLVIVSQNNDPKKIKETLDKGADTYVTISDDTEFPAQLIKAYADALLRRVDSDRVEKIKAKQFAIDLKNQEVFKDGCDDPINLTETEWLLLIRLAQARGGYVSSSSLRNVIGEFYAEGTEYVYIKRLKDKLTDNGSCLIENKHGLGYRLVGNQEDFITK